MSKPIPKGLTRDHVLFALADLDSGAEHPFGPAIGYELVYQGRRYPPKAVIGLAFKRKDGRNLGPMDFRGGQAPGQANAVLRDLGFDVAEIMENASGFITSRGYALPSSQAKMMESVWYNMWQRKYRPYDELVEGCTLYWFDSTRHAIIWKSRIAKVEKFQYTDKSSVKRRLKQVFADVNDFDDYFDRASSSGYCLAYKVDSVIAVAIPKPHSYRFPQGGWLSLNDIEARDWLRLFAPGSADEPNEEPYEPNGDDRRKIALREVRTRQGQTRFRQDLIERYGPNCMITGCNAFDVVEAAHIQPYLGEEDNHPQNGLLLRSDLHILFDLGQIAVDPETLAIHIAPCLAGTDYAGLNAMKLRCNGRKPSDAALGIRWQQFREQHCSE